MFTLAHVQCIFVIASTQEQCGNTIKHLFVFPLATKETIFFSDELGMSHTGLCINILYVIKIIKKIIKKNCLPLVEHCMCEEHNSICLEPMLITYKEHPCHISPFNYMVCMTVLVSRFCMCYVQRKERLLSNKK